MFLGHEIYEELKNIIGEDATIKIAKRFYGCPCYFPKATAADINFSANEGTSGMTPLEIQDALRANNTTQRQIAVELGIADITVSKVINRIIVSDRVMRAIASKIGRDHREVFPEYYSQPPKRSTSKVDIVTVKEEFRELLKEPETQNEIVTIILNGLNTNLLGLRSAIDALKNDAHQHA